MRVLLSGYYGFGNLGDEALLGGLLAALESRGVEALVLSGDPAATTALHGVAARHRTRGLLAGILESDAVVSGGGGLLQDGSSQRSLRYYLGVIGLARLLRRPTVVFAQSLGPLSPDGRTRVAAALKGVPVMVRDASSLGLAESLGLGASLVADPALLLPLPAEFAIATGPVSPAAPMKRTETKTELGPVLLIPRGGHPALNDALIGLASRLLAYGEPVQALAMHPSEDAAEVTRLVEAVPGVASVEAATPADALRLIAGVRYVVSVRLHGCILAARVGTGFAGLSYDPKVAGFLEQVGAPAFHLPVDVDALTRVVALPSDQPPFANEPGPNAAAGVVGSVQRAGFDAEALRRLTRLANDGVDRLVAALQSRSPGSRR